MYISQQHDEILSMEPSYLSVLTFQLRKTKDIEDKFEIVFMLESSLKLVIL